jgi:bifunctional N-acetylglucosamine-1-phosphate-uridyltransferase/glucosamine-1-phosphate-acetyltransferase GlmU-like protein
MVAHVLARFRAYCDRVVLVIHPSARGALEAYLPQAPMPAALAEQVDATGMLDAILLAGDAVRAGRPDRVWICWCDQLLLSDATLERMASREAETPAPAAVFPTARLGHPYIHFDRDATGKLVAVRQRREGDRMPELGESDAGVFSLSTDAYSEWLPQYARQPALGRATTERNFLPFLPWLSARAPVVTVAVADPIEAQGTNTPEDLALVERHLRATEGRE